MSHILDEEDLEALCYERSKAWSNVIKCCAEKEEGKEIDIRNFEEIFKDQDEDTIVAMEEAKEVNVEEELYKTTQSMTKTELMQMLCSGDSKEILDQTLPIVEGHVRKWKEAGLDRILDTFDGQQIEEHVGDWLRRNNSAFGGNNLLQVSPKAAKPFNGADQVYSTSSSNDSEAESMHSVDTARYIRASRKRTISTASKCSIPMTTIKMYRNVPRKRAELSAKYGCEEQEHRHHMQALLHRRSKFHSRKHERDLILQTSSKQYSHSFEGQQRRKQLRKRRDTSPMLSSSSSSEDERCDCTRRKKVAHSHYRNRSYHNHRINYRDYHCKRLKLGSRSTQDVLEEELRPRLMENECTCCSIERLCSNVVHIAKSSTESWIVQNTSSSNSSETCRVSSTNHSLALKKRTQQKIIKSQCCLRRHRRNENMKQTKTYSNEPKDTKSPTNEIQSDSSENSSDCSIKLKRTKEKMQTIESVSDNSDDLQSNCKNLNSTFSNQSCKLDTLKDQSEDTDSHTMVSSPTDYKSPTAPQRSSFNITKKGILLHEPPRQASASEDQDKNISLENSNANFTLTEQALTPIIGQRRARKLLKYHTGSNSFNSRYHVYYRPSAKLLTKLTDTDKSRELSSSSCSDTDSDVFEMLGRYGVVHSVLEKGNDSFKLD
ncbi:uncharacterized protein LOC117792353 [Drosophila innubila]|uniref:uncharacterized protein LOC117792353 n=1 Tax=Drosophila innubila TaxID=198719 RepID=UPI00148CF31F|nr:uncharacterized protein LOC117792353 [Drosophila innubila]